MFRIKGGVQGTPIGVWGHTNVKAIGQFFLNPKTGEVFTQIP